MLATTRRSSIAWASSSASLDVLARRLEVALAAAAARAPAEDVGPEQVAREARAVGERERLVEERDRRRDARELVAADAEPEEDVGAVDVRELRPFGELARDLEQVERLAGVAVLHARPGLAGERAHLELGRAGGADVARAPTRKLGGLVVAVRLRQRLGPGEQCLDPAAHVGRDAAAEERGVDAEPRRRASAIDSSVGRVLPRSIWLTYSFENRSPASCVCVRPAASRSERSRSPRREVGADGVVATARRDGRELAVLRGAVGGGVHLRRQSRRFTSPVPSPRRVRCRLPNAVICASEVEYRKSLDRAT